MTKVITYGTFDLFHEGHYRLLQRAKALGDYLIVGVTTESFDRARGKLGVLDPLLERVENVRRTGFADEIIVEEYVGQKVNDVQKYDIDIFTVGSDWAGKFENLKKYCRVVYLERTKDVSSTMLRNEKRRIQRVGIIGTGRIANRFVVEAKRVSGINLQGVFNPHRESARRFAEKWDIHAYDDPEDFYASVDIVYVASPHETHYGYIRSALERGKHVLAEKPLALTGGQAEEVFSLAHERHLLLVEGIKTAYCPGFHRLMGVIDSGKIGVVRHVETCFTKLENPKKRELTDVKYGGSFLELGSYVLLPIWKSFGTAYEKLSFDIIPGENGLDLFTRASFRFRTGLATATCGLGVKSEGRLLVAGTKGYIVATAPWWKTTEFEVHYEDSAKVEKFSEIFLGDGLRYELSDLLVQIGRGKGTPAGLTPQESIAGARAMEAFLREHRPGVLPDCGRG